MGLACGGTWAAVPRLPGGVARRNAAIRRALACLSPPAPAAPGKRPVHCRPCNPVCQAAGGQGAALRRFRACACGCARLGAVAAVAAAPLGNSCCRCCNCAGCERATMQFLLRPPPAPQTPLPSMARGRRLGRTCRRPRCTTCMSGCWRWARFVGLGGQLGRTGEWPNDGRPLRCPADPLHPPPKALHPPTPPTPHPTLAPLPRPCLPPAGHPWRTCAPRTWPRRRRSGGAACWAPAPGPRCCAAWC